MLFPQQTHHYFDLMRERATLGACRSRRERSYDLERNGRRFLVTRTKKAPSVEITRINLVLNWFEELKAKVPAGQ